jgi:hypothetical protein
MAGTRRAMTGGMTRAVRQSFWWLVKILACRMTAGTGDAPAMWLAMQEDWNRK